MKFIARNKARLKWMITPKAERDALMEKALQQGTFVDDMAPLLKMAQEDGVVIRPSAALIGTGTSAGLLPKNDGTFEILINPERLQEPGADFSMLHELYHYAQYKRVGLTGADKEMRLPNLRKKMLCTRVIEADAYASCQMALERMEYTAKTIAAVRAKGCEMAGKKEGEELSTEEFMAAATAFNAESREEPDLYSPQRKEELFRKYLKKLGSYDMECVNNHLQWQLTRPPTDKASQELAMSVSDIRKVLQADLQGTPYFESMSDKDFEAMVMQDVHPDLRAAVDLSEEFDAATGPQEKTAAMFHAKRHALRARMDVKPN